MKKFLPIGSVVLLKESQKRIMIVGVKQKQANSDKVWDYSACLYPEGILDPEKLFLFDTEQIERLYFIGLQDGEGLAFLNKINHLDDNADTTNLLLGNERFCLWKNQYVIPTLANDQTTKIIFLSMACI